MNRPLAGAAAVAVLLLAGCGTAGGFGPMPEHGASGRPAAGRVTGRLLLEGGPIRPGGRQPGPRPIRGVLAFTATGQRPVRVRAGDRKSTRLNSSHVRISYAVFCLKKKKKKKKSKNKKKKKKKKK